jgi:NAD+ diphosphatase
MKKEDLGKFDVNFTLYIGTYMGKAAFVVDLNNSEEKFYNLTDVFAINEDLFLVGGRAVQVLDWYKNHQYCGICGTHNIIDDKEMMLKCPKCGHMNFTRIAPAIIVAITKGDELLMAYHSYYEIKTYTILAGFVEAGETLEEAVRREVKEEVGINIKNIKYFGSQSWPFPNSLMVGFTAEYESGDIKVDNFEILKAKWFKKDEIKRRSNISISSWLIDDFIDNH